MVIAMQDPSGVGAQSAAQQAQAAQAEEEGWSGTAVSCWSAHTIAPKVRWCGSG